MPDLLTGPLAVAATHAYAQSALPDAPVVAARQRPGRLRRTSARALGRLTNRRAAV